MALFFRATKSFPIRRLLRRSGFSALHKKIQLGGSDYITEWLGDLKRGWSLMGPALSPSRRWWEGKEEGGREGGAREGERGRGPGRGPGSGDDGRQ